MKKGLFLAVLTVLTLAFLPHTGEARDASYIGYKKCGGCHKSQRNSWLETTHAHTFELLKPGAEVEAKKKAKLDPKKDYTNNKDCLPCHVTGYGDKGGYTDSMSETKKQYYLGVTCEECHGAGSLFRKQHSKGGKLYRKRQKSTSRKVLVSAGQNFDYEKACDKCHMNYKGSPWKGAKAPYTPFTPQVDPKYKFDFNKAVHEIGKNKAMHEHFKLRGVFTGEPVPKIRAEFQKTAKEPGAEEGDEEENGGDNEE